MKLSEFNWGGGVFLIVYQLAFLVTFPLYLLHSEQSLGLWLTLPILALLCGLGTTTLYHRYYSHKTYRLHKAAETVILFFGTLAVQGSALKWSHDHRLHHRFVDTDRDPYSINKGFWYAHFFWMLEKRKKFDPKVVPDLMKNRLVVFQDRYYVPLLIVTNAAVILFFGWLFNDLAGSFVLLFLTRVFYNQHTTWFINSAAHYWGVQPYSKEHTAVNNWLIALFTYGEGYHNYHHTFSSDYRNGVRWYQYDPTKALIWALSRVGLAHGLKRMDHTTISRKLLLEDRKLMLDRLKRISYVKIEVMEREIDRKVEELSAKLSTFRARIEEYRELRRSRAKEAREAKARVKAMRKSLKLELRSWSKYCDRVLQLRPTLA